MVVYFTGCSDGSVPVNCLVNPCDTASCPAINGAVCVADYCGGCHARWLLNGDDVTNQCQGQFLQVKNEEQIIII